jgi:hypothetical protein
MLIITRKRNEKILIGNDIEITILEIGSNRLRVGIQAPKHIIIHTRLKTLPPAAAGDNITPIQISKPSEPVQTLPPAAGMWKK